MATSVQWNIGDPFSAMPLYYAGIILAVGLLENFLGYKIFKIQVAIVLFAAGAYYGYLLLGPTVHHILGIIAGVLLGMFLAAISIKIYKAGVFLFVGLWTGLLAASITDLLWAGVIAGIILGLIGAALVKPGIIISSSMAGGSMMAAGILGLLRLNFYNVFWIGAFSLAIAGAVFQFSHNKDVPIAGDHQ